MSSKVYVDVKVRLILDLEKNVEIGEFIAELDYQFKGNTPGGTILDTEITDFQVRDSK